MPRKIDVVELDQPDMSSDLSSRVERSKPGEIMTIETAMMEIRYEACNSDQTLKGRSF